MAIVNGTALESNKNFRVNFDGGNLSSDGGLLLLKEFYHKLGVNSLLRKQFHTTDSAAFRIHKDHENLLQMLYQITGAYFQDDHADSLRNDPVVTSAVGKAALASQPTLSRFHNRMDEVSLKQLEEIQRILQKRVYSIEKPEYILFDLDSTLLATYGSQEGEAFNYHYQAHGYHPLLCFDGMTEDLLKVELRPGTQYCSKGAAVFMLPLLEEYQKEYPGTALFARGDSGFATDELYSLFETNGTSYAVRLKENAVIRKLATDLDSELYDLTKEDAISYAVIYGEFEYKAGSWDYPRRVVCKIEKPYGQMTHMNTFIVTNMDSSPVDLIRFYCKRGQMENFIKECKTGFDMSYVSSSSQIVNANRVQIHALDYNLFNWFRRLVLPEPMRKDRIDTVRLKLLKIAARIVRTARYVYFKLCITRSGSKANLYFMWLRYKKEHPTGYQYTQFCRYYNEYVAMHYGAKGLSMVVERVSGEKLYIDWIGDQPELLVDPTTGALVKVHFFVTTLGVSSYIYAEAFLDEKLGSFIAGTVHALEFYNAVPKQLVPDNLRAAVTRHTRDELVLNSAYQDLENFYDVVVLPPPARKPTGKATVEGGVRWLETHLLEDLKDKVYYSLDEINHDVRLKIAELNNRKMQKQSFSRKEAFEQYDRPQMRSLDNGSFALCEYKYFAKVPNNYHLLYDGHYYSVMYMQYGQPVILKATMAEIRICNRNNKLLCTHRRSYTDFPKYITKPEHMKPEHQYYRDVNSKDGNYYRRWAASYGPYTAKMIDNVLLASEHEEQAYNSCNGMLHMCTNQPKLLVEEAAKLCVEGNACRYSYFKKALNNLKYAAAASKEQKLPEHKNLRGKEIYK